MIIAIDTETKGLDATQFLCGVICYEDMTKEYFFQKEAMWQRILLLGEQLRKRKQRLIIYAHNMRYDFYAITDWNDHEIKEYSDRPFIMERNNIKFTDSMAIFNMSLEKLGKMINLPKLAMPPGLAENNNNNVFSFIDINKIRDYCMRDTEIVMQAIKNMRQMLKEQGINTRTLITIGQIAISHFTNWLSKKPYKEAFMTQTIEEPYHYLRWKWHHTEHPEIIRNSYRGGRVEALTLGQIKKATLIDVNSLYPCAAMNMRMPDLRTEKEEKKPDKKKLDKIGVTYCKLSVPKQEIPFLPLRQGDNNIYPNGKKIIIGTWTNDELKYAIKLGYKIQKYYKMITYKETINPFKEYFTEMYKRRKEEKDEFKNYFYKGIMNHLIGKFAQINTLYDRKWDSVEKFYEYKRKDYTVINEGQGLQYCYEKKIGETLPSWSAPIISSLVTATARIIMHKYLLIAGKGNIHYIDTDSMLLTAKTESFKYGEKLGEFKKEFEEEDAFIYTKKGYIIGNEIKLSGAFKTSLNKEDFMKGLAKYKRIITPKTARNPEQIGKFEEVIVDLNQSMQEHLQELQRIDEQELLIDRNDEANWQGEF